jgi:hypothetical protein
MKTAIFFMALSLGAVFSGCKKSNPSGPADAPTPTPTPFQGPLNASFETDTDWVSLYNGSGGTYSQHRATGTGFMPTKGSYYMDLFATGSNNWYTSGSGTYQENVDFSRSTTMTFDYRLSALGSSSVSILFTANGTRDLWDWTGTSASVTQLNQTIILPSLPDKGKLTISVGCTGSDSSIDFDIDNIRVQ